LKQGTLTRRAWLFTREYSDFFGLVGIGRFDGGSEKEKLLVAVGLQY
jgi:hypothetical protein